MNIILLQDVEKVGKKFELVEVKPGYARNFLIPKKMAIIANRENLAKLDEHKQKETAKESKLIEEYNVLKTKIEGANFKIGAKAGTSGKIFGSVTSVQVIQALQNTLGIEVDRKIVEMPEEVKDLGAYEAIIKFHPKVEATLKFEVVAE